MRKIYEPFSRMTETGDGYHSNEVRVKKKLDRKSTTEKARQKKLREWGGMPLEQKSGEISGS